ncbi:hypothetical protein V8E36_009503 [Tilletia maclaganii]
MAPGQHRQEASTSGGSAGSSSHAQAPQEKPQHGNARSSRQSQHHSAGMGAHHRNKSGSALARNSRSTSRTSLVAHGRTNSSHRLTNLGGAAAGLTMTRTHSIGASSTGGGGAGHTAKAGSSAGSSSHHQQHTSKASEFSQHRSAAPGPRRGSAGSSASNSSRAGLTSLSAANPTGPRRGMPPPKKPVKFTMGDEDEDDDEETESDSDDWSEDEKSGNKHSGVTDHTSIAADEAPRIQGDYQGNKGKGTDRADSGRPKAGEEEEEEEEVLNAEDDDDAWSSDEPTEEELRREAEAKAAAERERRRAEEEKQQRELFQKVEVPVRSASVADITQLRRHGFSNVANGSVRQGQGDMGPPLVPPPRSLLSAMFHSEQENQIRAYRLSRMMGSHAEAEQVRKAQLAAHASQPHLPQHAHEQAQALARIQAQSRARAEAQAQQSRTQGQEQTQPPAPQSRAQSRPRGPPPNSGAERDGGPRRSSSIASGLDRGILRPSKSAVALPLLSKLELKSSTSQGNSGPSGSYLRRTPSDAGSGSIGSVPRSLAEKGPEPILLLEPVGNDEPMSESVSSRSLRKADRPSSRASAASGDTTAQPPSPAGPTVRTPAPAAERSQSADRQHPAIPVHAPSVASHRHSSTALNLLGEGGYEMLLPAGAIAQTPRTTRRNMLRDELSESVRANLLWERQSRTRRMGSASAASGVGATGFFPNQPVGRVVNAGGMGPGDGMNGQGGLASAPAPALPLGGGGGSGGGRPGQKNTVLSGDRLRPLTSSSTSHHTSPPDGKPRRPSMGIGGSGLRTNSDGGPSSGASSSDEEDLYADAARRRHTYDHHNSFHHSGW